MNGTLYQVSTLDSLMQGWFYPVKKVGELREHGDTGIGAFTGADGELIALDGQFYRATYDGKVALAGDEETVPFACVANFDAEWTSDVTLTATLGSMENALSGVVDDFNHIYLVRLDGYFQSVSVRTVKGQREPYPTLKSAMAEQKIVTRGNVKGSIVALYCPPYLSGLNLPGWHTHFISADRKTAGHVLDLSLASGKAAFTRLTNFTVSLPNDERFAAMDLTKDMSGDTRAVER